MQTAKIINNTGKRVYFEAVLPQLPEQLPALIAQLQEEKGFYIAGYGEPFQQSVEVLPEGGYRVTWACAASCD